MNTLENQVAVVTGASSGIGKAIALELAAQGASLCLVGRKLETLQSVVDAAKGKAGRHHCFQADLSVDHEVDELIAAIKRDVQAVDILVHGAGVIWLGPLESAAADRLDSHYKTNVRAPYVLTQGLLPALKSRQGQVLFLNSSAGYAAKANASQYAASKHALKAVADSLREEVNPAGVRVLSLFLGRTASPMQAALHATEGKAYQPELLMQPEDVAAVAIHALTLPRTIEITEISMRPLVKSY
ncbi:SDR family oxidoreductase [Caenimonas soli]|uniref:SDR family oxidoreductase n=1 Tax=Caenimonas soli TaxID=2735555 RepID=UPI00155573D9|nr:SDR family NAD(P)-dependent oxidoreductase [Caenimonas soli]NPC55549.1 SDR family NAD(P)-dependent oxidoreductase [Caenimonas soli]